MKSELNLGFLRLKEGYSEEELEVIDTVCGKMKNLSAHDISELSHAEPAWQKHLHQGESIPFEEAFTLVGV